MTSNQPQNQSNNATVNHSNPSLHSTHQTQPQQSIHGSPRNTLSPSTSLPLSGTSSLSPTIGNGAWPNYEFPSKWECNEDYMCVHFIARTADKSTWNSQCLFWSEAIRLYAQQLMYQCPHSWNRLSFTVKDIIHAYTRKNRMTPLCIPDIFRFMKHHQQNIEFTRSIDANYENRSSSSSTKHVQTQSSSGWISDVSSMVSSMFGYIIPNYTNSDDDDEDLERSEEMKIAVDDDTKCVYLPIMEELCTKLSSLQFYKQAFHHHDRSLADLSQLIDIGIIESSPRQNSNEFIINGLVFYRFCVQILKLTIFDIDVLKKYLIMTNRIRLFYMNDTDYFNETQQQHTFTTTVSATTIDANNFHDLKNEMIFFAPNHVQNKNLTMTANQEQMTKMQLLSIQMTMKHLQFQRSENENNLNHINSELMQKLKGIPTEKRRHFMKENMTLIKRKKWLKTRISNLDGSLYNLETTLHSVQDMSINKMVFNEMKNADKMLKCMLKDTPSVEEVHELNEDIKESMAMNQELGDALSKPIDSDYDVDISLNDDELMKEYEDLEMENAKELELPDAPSHDVVIKDKAHAEEGGGEEQEVDENTDQNQGVAAVMMN
eukprot:CAMPEP_0197040102 /NCGR_PEP_ID=MMETSP1384-20130603/16840_1 /TAXON_ID=29189 /ORGANISM="Ammonia sp." /LENGTH=601 /DNA_ID=CAMNT_0042470797 /DNA_START=108 /DNA_END=1913 /DNA_ORIENTATION=-